MNPLERSTDELSRDFVFARSRVAAQGRITLLHIGQQETVVLGGPDAVPDIVLVLALGSSRTADRFFRHDPPTPAELETAIDTVEDEVMRARAAASDGSTLITTDGALRELANTSGEPVQGGRAIALDAVEMLFQRLASASLGDTGALRETPPGREVAAVLLILREFMHHLGHASITVVDLPILAPYAPLPG